MVDIKKPKNKPTAEEVSQPTIHIEGTAVVEGERYSFKCDLPLKDEGKCTPQHNVRALCSPKVH
jgi:hypothetical protein